MGPKKARSKQEKAKPQQEKAKPEEQTAKPKRRSRKVQFGAIAAIAIGIAVAIFAGYRLRHGKDAAPPAATIAASGYVDDAQCASCHQDIATTYAKTGMGRSFFKPTTSNVVEDYTHANTFDHKLSGLNYTMIERNGQFFEQRSQPGFDGKPSNVLEEKIDYVIGSGNHSRSYLHRAPNGQLIELPVSWYSEHNGYWAMSPGYDWKGQKDFGRAITPECMFCHNGFPQGNTGLDRSMFQAKLPDGIGCQRCHGPGLAHIQAARAAHPVAQLVQSTIVNPGHLPRERQLEVCMQCHLETSHHEPNEQRLFDRAIFSYRPGQPLADFQLYFDPVSAAKPGAAGSDDFEIAHAAYRLRKSACFRNSQMTCLTCHDPHDIPRGEEAIAHYTEVCLSCHAGIKHTVALPATSTCISCHMPRRRTEDAVHVVMTDHFIRREQPRRDLLAPIAETQDTGTPPKVALYYPAKQPLTPAAEIAVAEVQATGSQQDDNGIAHLQELLERYHPNAPEPYLALAKAYERTGDNGAVARWSQQALDERADYRPALVELATALFATHRETEATKLLESGVERFPTDDLLLSDLGNAYLRQGDLTQASAILERAVQANPDRPESHDLLGRTAARQGDMATAEREFREAVRCQTDDAQALDDLGNILIQKKSYDEAKFQLEKAIASDAGYAAAHRHLGRLLVVMGQIPHGVAELREAARLDPNGVPTLEDLADVLGATGQADDAMTEYTRILMLKPEDPRAELGMGMVLLGQRKVEDARTHLEIAARSSDPEVARSAAQVLAQLPR